MVHVLLNQEYRTGTASSPDQTITREAVRIELLTAPGSAPLSTLVLGSATAGRHGDVCANNPPNNPPTNPPTFPPGSNEPGSNGGDVFGHAPAAGGLTSSGPGSQPGGRVGVLGRQVNGLNGSECAHMRVFWDLQRGVTGRSTAP